MPTKLLFAEGIGCDIGLLAYADFVHVGFIDVHPHAQHCSVADGQDRIRRGGRVGNAFSVAVMLAEDDPVNRRLDEGLVVPGLGLGQVRLRQFQICPGKGNIFFASGGVYSE